MYQQLKDEFLISIVVVLMLLDHRVLPELMLVPEAAPKFAGRCSESSSHRTLVSSIARQHCYLPWTCVFDSYLFLLWWPLVQKKRRKVASGVPAVGTAGLGALLDVKKPLMEYHMLSCSPLRVHRSISEV